MNRARIAWLLRELANEIDKPPHKSPPRRGTLADAVLSSLGNMTAMRAGEVLGAAAVPTGTSIDTIRTVLSKLAKRGLVTRAGHGLYVLGTRSDHATRRGS
jgi:DNA-binding GntR family transcriptional regulator